MSDLIYKILDAAAWQELREAGHYHGSAVDLKDGHIHFSTATQLRETLQKHFPGGRDLVLVAVDVTALPDEAVKWEEARGSALFPHLYSPLPLSAVRESWPLHLDDIGVHILPSELA